MHASQAEASAHFKKIQTLQNAWKPGRQVEMTSKVKV